MRTLPTIPLQPLRAVRELVPLTQVRLLLLALALLVLVSGGIGYALSSQAPGGAAGVGVAVAILSSRWVVGMRRGSFSLAGAPLEFGALMYLALASGSPDVNGVIFSGLFFRALFGSGRRVVPVAAAYIGVSLGSPIAGDALGISVTTTDPGEALSLVMIATVMSVLTGTLRAQGSSANRERVLRRAGGALAASQGAERVQRVALNAVHELVGNEDRVALLAYGSVAPMEVVAASGRGSAGLVGLSIAAEGLGEEVGRRLRAGEVVEGLEAGLLGLAAPLDHGSVDAFAVVPLRSQGALRGLLAVSRDTPLGARLEEALEALAREVVLALESAVLTAELQEQSAERRFRALVQNSSDVISILEADSTVLYQSPSIERILGYAPDALVGTRLIDLVHPDDATRVMINFARPDSGRTGRVVVECRWRHRDGSWRDMENVRADLRDNPEVGGMVLTSRDVTERRRLEDQLTHQAFHDPLTGLANRALFRDRVEHALSAAKRSEDPPAVLFIDLDDFKHLNDSLGHDAGDRLLVEVAARLRSCIRASDTAARLGGDEYALLLEGAGGREQVMTIAEQVADALRVPVRLGAREVVVSGSLGIAVAQFGQDSAGLLGAADLAMYSAKANGKGGCQEFEPSMLAAALHRVELETELRAALAGDELFVEYQPLVRLDGGGIVGVEALVRWWHPTRGRIAPAEFIPLAEETGLVVALGAQVLDEACRQLAGWPEAPAGEEPLWVSVNVSVRQLREPDFVALVAGAVERAGIDPDRLVLEITESAVMDDVVATRAVLLELSALGVRVALDDFGTGHSSLSYLERLPAQMLKVAREFVTGLGTPNGSALAGGILELGRSLGLTLVAEGIETEVQLAELRRLGAEVGQGYGLHRPMPGHDVAALLESARPVSVEIA